MTDDTEDKKLVAIEEELAAIKTVLGALTPLKPEARSNVIDYVFRHLGIMPPAASKPAPSAVDPVATPHVVAPHPRVPPHSGAQIDLRTLTEQKRPKSDNQMVAVLAYYLATHAPEDQRRDYIVPDDIKKYFPSANFELPTGSPAQTLGNAKNAGYLDVLARGQYRLNPVGHNLVTHKLPHGDGSAASRAPHRVKKAAARKKKARP